MSSNNLVANGGCPHMAVNQKPYHKSLAMAACLALALLTGGVAQAALDSKGTDFWLMFNQNYYGGSALTLFITGDTATSGTVKIPGLGFSQAFTVAPGAVTSVVIPPGAEVDTNDVIENKGIHVTAQAEVTVYGLNRIVATTDAFLGLPSDILSTDYIVLGYTSVGLASEFGVVATQNATTVTITPSMTTGTHLAGIPYTISLNQGQTYQLGLVGYGLDLSGSLIASNKPVAVFGGNACTDIPLGYYYCDHVVEELPPTSTWGKAFVTLPLATRFYGDTFRILAAKDNTQVSLNGIVVATLNKGQFHEQIVADPSYITASQPVLVAQYSNSTSFDGVTSDPFMTLIPPYEQFLNKYTVTTPASGFPINYINVVASNADIGNVTVDGTPIPPASFQPIVGTAFAGAQVPVALGGHTLASVLPFGVTVYGFAEADSYGYPGGMSLAKIATVAGLTLSPKTQIQKVSNFPNIPTCVTATVADQNNAPVPGIRVDFTVTGVNSKQGFAVSDTAGHAQFCYTGGCVISGKDTITGSAGSFGDTASVQWAGNCSIR